MEGERAASETVGAVLMVAIVVVSVSALSVGLVAMRTTGPTAPQVSFDGAVTTQNVSVTNAGGASLNASALRVVVRKSDGTQVVFTPDPANVSGTDGQFDPGETVERAHGLSLAAGDRATVLVVHEPSASVLFSATLVTAAAGGSGGGGGGGGGNVETANTYTMQENEEVTLDSGIDAASYEWQVVDDVGVLSAWDTRTPRFWVESDLTAERVIEVVVKATYANGSSVTRKVTVHVKPTSDTEPPTVSNYEVTGGTNQLTVSFASSERLSTVEVSVSGPTNLTLTASDFSATNDSGTWRYSATISVSATGEYEATLVEARDRAGNGYGGRLSGTATVTGGGQPPVGTPAAYEDVNRNGEFDPDVDFNVTAEIRDGTFVANQSAAVVVTAAADPISAQTIRIVGSGVTVRTDVTATDGSLTLDARGGTLDVSGSRIDATGAYEGDVTLTGGTVVADSAVVASARPVTIESTTGRVSLVGAHVNGTYGYGHVLRVRSADGVALADATLETSGRLVLDAAGRVHGTGVTLDSTSGQSEITVTAPDGVSLTDGRVTAGKNVRVSSAGTVTLDGTVVRANGDVTVRSRTAAVSATDATINATAYGATVTVTADTDAALTGLELDAKGDVTLSAGGTLDLSEATVRDTNTGATLSVTGGTVVAADARLVTATTIRLEATRGRLDVSGALVDNSGQYGRAVTLTAKKGALDAANLTLRTKGRVKLEARASVSLVDARVVNTNYGAATTVTGESVRATGASLATSGPVEVTAKKGAIRAANASIDTTGGYGMEITLDAKTDVVLNETVLRTQRGAASAKLKGTVYVEDAEFRVKNDVLSVKGKVTVVGEPAYGRVR